MNVLFNVCIESSLIEHLYNQTLLAILFKLEHNTRIMGNMRSIVKKIFGKFRKHLGADPDNIKGGALEVKAG